MGEERLVVDEEQMQMAAMDQMMGMGGGGAPGLPGAPPQGALPAPPEEVPGAETTEAATQNAPSDVMQAMGPTPIPVA